MDLLNQIGNKIKVILRTKPNDPDEADIFQNNFEIEKVNNSYFFKNNLETFRTDEFEQNVTQSVFFINQISAYIDKCISGINISILCYGYTGTGKTFTVFGEPRSPGIVERCVGAILKAKASVSIRIVEVYLDDAYDLLSPGKEKIAVSGSGDCMATKVQVESETVLSAVLSICKRKTSKNAVHSKSSRSHCIVMLTVQNEDITSELYIADLAGCERTGSESLEANLDSTFCGKPTGGHGLTNIRESNAINKSVFALNNVVKACAENKSHIPYRDSKITMLLKRSIGGDSLTAIVLCCSPNNLFETICTLRFGMRCQKISNKILVQSISMKSAKKIEEDILESEIETLKRKLSEIQYKLSTTNFETMSVTIQGMDTGRYFVCSGCNALRNTHGDYIASLRSSNRDYETNGCLEIKTPVCLEINADVDIPEGFLAKPEGFLANPEGSIEKLESFLAKPDGFLANPEGFIENPEGFLANTEGFLANPEGFLAKAAGDINKGFLAKPVGDIIANTTGDIATGSDIAIAEIAVLVGITEENDTQSPTTIPTHEKNNVSVSCFGCK